MLAHRLNPRNEGMAEEREAGYLILWHGAEWRERPRYRRELQPAASPSVYHIDDSLANVKSLYLPSRDLSFILRVNLPAPRDNKSACVRVLSLSVVKDSTFTFT